MTRRSCGSTAALLSLLLVIQLGLAPTASAQPEPVFSINDVTVPAEGTGGTISATFTVSLSPPSSQEVTVQYSSSNGTGLGGTSCDQGIDYLIANGTLTFSPNATTRTIGVTICGDALDESSETFFVDLFSAAGAGIADPRGQATIVDDDAPPTLSVIGTSAFEGRSLSDSDAPPITNVSVRVTLSRAINQSVTFKYATQPRIFIGQPTLLPPVGRVPILIPPIFDRAATAGSQCGGSGGNVDYLEAQGELTIAPGSTTATIPLRLCADARDELDESFFVAISNATNAQILHRRATVTIRNDDPRTIRIDSPQVTEGNIGTVNLTYTLNMSTPVVEPVIVKYETRDRTAVGGASCSAGVDFIRTSGEVTFAPGQTVKRVPVQVCGDTRAEPSETVGVRIESTAFLGSSTGIGTIEDDDGP